MSKLKGKPAAPVAPDPETPAEGEEQPDPAVDDGAVDPAIADAQRIADLEAENAELKRDRAAPAAPSAPQAKVTAAQLRAMPKDQREAVELNFGRPFDDIVHEVESHELRSQNWDLASRVNVRDAIDDAQAADPKVHNLKTHMKAYLDRLPLEVRADPERLKAEITHAKTYARGKFVETNGGSAPARTPGKGGKVNAMPTPGGPDPEPEMEEGAVKSGTEFKSRDGKFGFTVGAEIPEETRKKIAHPSDVNGIQFPKEEPLRFNRG